MGRNESVFRVFLSWSGEQSRVVADGLRNLVTLLVDEPKVWMSATDIPDGSRWSDELAQTLDETDFGIIVVTPDNMISPWLLFEAGALSKRLREARVIPYLIGIDKRNLSGPLAQFQAVPADRDGTWRVIAAILEAADRQVSRDAIVKRFGVFWSEMESVLVAARQMTTITQSAALTDSRDMPLVTALQAQVAELAELVRQLVPPRDELARPTSSVSVLDLRSLEGAWASEHSRIYIKIINGRIHAPYCYEGNDELTGIYYDWQPFLDHFFARFKWLRHPISGFAFYKPLDEDTLEGMWWLSSDVPVQSFVEVPSAGGAKAVWHRQRGCPAPVWAETYFYKLSDGLER